MEFLKKATDKNLETNARSEKSFSLKDKEKFKKILKETKDKSKEEKKSKKEIPLHELFTQRTNEDNHKNDKELSPDIQSQPMLAALLKESQSAFQETKSASGVSFIDPIYQRFQPEIREFFQDLVSEMVFLNSSGKSQTMITLSSPHLQSSPLYGMQILITEYSSAPKLFNVELYANATAMALVAPSLKEFTNTFDKSKFPFDIHRFELYNQEESSLLKKVESLLSDEEESEK